MQFLALACGLVWLFGGLVVLFGGFSGFFGGLVGLLGGPSGLFGGTLGFVRWPRRKVNKKNYEELGIIKKNRE